MDNQSQPTAAPTIAAIATGAGGAIAILRLSGVEAVPVARRLCTLGERLGTVRARTLTLTDVCGEDGTVLDQVLVVRFDHGHSYTGEPLVEIHCHGGRLVARRILARALACGARPAEPGEFTRRAFLNGKLDLTQAEAVADIISAGSSLALRLAEEQLHGALGRRIQLLYEQLERVLGEAEAHLDFPDERLDLWSGAQAAAAIAEIANGLKELLRNQQRGALLRHGVRVVIAGLPNVGKSSLLNALLGRDRAIVNPIPGTTRDTLEESLDLNGVPVCLVDTAGMRESPDVIEQDGVARARQAMQTAEVVLWVQDASRPEPDPVVPAEATRARNLLRVWNKCDLLPAAAPTAADDGDVLRVSAMTGAGLDRLCERITHLVWGGEPQAADDACINERHACLLRRAVIELSDAREETISDRWELAAVALRAALAEVGKISGKTHTPDILDSIFARFCIGK